MTLARLVFLSEATQPMTPAELDAFCRTLHQANARRDMTGLLVHAGGTFLQVLEGPLETVVDFYALLRDDPRHKAVVRLMLRPAEARLFAAWPMALLDLDAGPAEARATLQEFLGQVRGPFAGAPDIGELVRVLRVFRQHLPTEAGVTK